ncbi:MAG: cell division protein ZapA [Paludibacteraceae bacterium]|nr:cell division protein ZapA [Paludibacteraceae bacterium]
MEEARKQHITLQLDAHHISLNVVADKEVLYRNAAEQINERYRHYRKMLPTHSAEQIWVYVALETAVNLQADAHAHRLQPIDEKIQELNQLILNTLQNNKLLD